MYRRLTALNVGEYFIIGKGDTAFRARFVGIDNACGEKVYMFSVGNGLFYSTTNLDEIDDEVDKLL